MADQKMELYLVGGVAAVAVLYVVMKGGGGSSSTGVSFSAPNSASVAAVESANANIAASINSGQVARATLATQLLTSQMTTRAGVEMNATNDRTTQAVAANNNATTLGVAQSNNATALASNKITASTADTVAAYSYKSAVAGANAATAQADIASKTILGVSSMDNTTQRQATVINNQTSRLNNTVDNTTQRFANTLQAGTTRYVAQQNQILGSNQAVQSAQAAVQVSNNQASAQKAAASDSMWGNIVGSVTGVLGKVGL